MALIIKDRVKEVTTTTGTGTITLAGASTGFRSFADIGDANTTYYCISGGSQFEVGLGTYTASGTTLSRDTVLSNSLGTTALINFSAGTKDVFCTYPSEKALLGNTSAVSSTGTGSVVLSDSPVLNGANIINTAFLPLSQFSLSYTAIGINNQDFGSNTVQIGSGSLNEYTTINIGANGDDESYSTITNLNGSINFTDPNATIFFPNTYNYGAMTVNSTTTITGNLQLTGSSTVNQNIATNQTTGNLTIGKSTATGTIDIKTPKINFPPLGTASSGATSFSSPALWLQNSKYVSGVSYTSGFRMQAQFDASTNTETLLFDPPLETTDRTTVIKYAFKNTQMQVMNNNDAMGFEFMATYGTAYLGIFNSGGAIGIFPANGYRNLFAIQRSDASVGACTPNNGGVPAFTNKLDDGSGNLIVGGDASTINSSRYLAVKHTTASTSTTTGALQVAGGAGIAGALNTGADATVNGITIGKGIGSVNQDNVKIGNNVLTNNTTGEGILAVGSNSMAANTTGRFIAAFGASALGKNTTGIINCAFGSSSLGENTTGSSNIGFGDSALRSNISGGNSIGIGFNAGRFISTGTGLGTINQSIFIGNNTKSLANSETNTIVIGHGAVGIGSNTTVIGNSSTTQTKVFGAIQSTTYTVATLPSASTVGVGARAFVTDASTPVFGMAVVGSGAVPVPVYSTGSAWNVG